MSCCLDIGHWCSHRWPDLRLAYYTSNHSMSCLGWFEHINILTFLNEITVFLSNQDLVYFRSWNSAFSKFGTRNHSEAANLLLHLQTFDLEYKLCDTAAYLRDASCEEISWIRKILLCFSLFKRIENYTFSRNFWVFQEICTKVTCISDIFSFVSCQELSAGLRYVLSLSVAWLYHSLTQITLFSFVTGMNFHSSWI